MTGVATLHKTRQRAKKNSRRHQASLSATWQSKRGYYICCKNTELLTTRRRPPEAEQIAP